MRRMPLAIMALAAAITGAGAHAQDSNLGRSLAATCANCHGTNGVSQGGTPSLAGVNKDVMSKMMKDFKSGARTGTVMPQLAKGYTDAQIDVLAAWFAAQKPAQ